MKDCFETPPMKEEMYLDNYETHLPEVIELSVRGERASSNYLQALELTQTVIKSLEKNDLPTRSLFWPNFNYAEMGPKTPQR